MPTGPRIPNWLDYGFRPFFLLAAAYAVLAPLLWLTRLAGTTWAGAPLDPLAMHGHEMITGFAGAAIAGFLLTAVPSWTGRPQRRGMLLLALVGLWLLARAVNTAAAGLPWWLAALTDGAMWLLLWGCIADDIAQARQGRQWPILVVLAVLGFWSTAFHAAAAGHLGLSAHQINTAQLHTVLLLVVIIAGRIVPAFTRNWGSAKGMTRPPVSRTVTEVLAVATTLAVAVAHTLGLAALGPLALAAALAHAVRLSFWRGLATTREPLLFVLHVGYAWVVIGYVLLSLGGFGLIAASVGVHALGLGVIGTMILAVMTRAGLGHTGRKLHASPALVAAFVLVNLAAVFRVVVALAPATGMAGLWVSGLAWFAAFGLFLAVFWPILTGPRADAKGCQAPMPVKVGS